MSAVASLSLGVGACGSGGVNNVSAAVTPEIAVDAPPGPPPALPLQVIAGDPPFPVAARYATARSIAADAREDLKMFAQAQHCWPSVRPDPTLYKQFAASILASASEPSSPRCLAEPAAVKRFAEQVRQNAFDRGPTAPPSIFEAFVWGSSYGKIAGEACAGKLPAAPIAEFKRRWESDVRIQRTGDPTIDGAFATILADPRFVDAMGSIRVLLVQSNANVMIVYDLDTACTGDKPVCSVPAPLQGCPRGIEADAREGLARTVTNGKTGYFPNANDFETDYPIGLEVRGFTIGDERRITGAVCLNFGRVRDEPPARQPGVFEQAQAAACLLRALGVAGVSERFEFTDMSPAEFKRRIPRLIDFNVERAAISRRAFDVLRSIYAAKKGS